jgi:glycosyltransferase involved in cell wall biosynthesis
LQRLLKALKTQLTEGMFTYSIVIADNDVNGSAYAAADCFLAGSGLALTYCIETEQNISLARNLALKHAEGDMIAFIDDDEYPGEDWLLRLFQTRDRYSASGVLGPVKPYFEDDPPSWVSKGRFFERPDYVTGRPLHWSEARTGNVLFERKILQGVDVPFRAELGSGGEDVDFFRRMHQNGHSFVWCSQAPVYEIVPPSRCNRTYLLKRALLRGSTYPKRGAHRLKNVAKSLLAVPAYLVLLPFLRIAGEHLFVEYLIRLCDHGARLLAFAGLRLQTKRQM